MALLFCDGFDWLSATADIAQQYRDGGSKSSYQATNSFRSGKCVRFTGSNSNTSGMSGIFQELYAQPSGTTLRLFFRIRTSGWTGNVSTLGSNFPTAGEALIKLQRLWEGTFGPCFSIGLNSTGKLVVMRAVDTTQNGRPAVAIGTVTLNDGSWHRVELEVVFNSSTGTCKCWVDGSLDINTTGLNTDATATGRKTTELGTIGIGLGKNNATTDWTEFDDVIVWDDSGSDFTGAFSGADVRIDTILPNAAGDSAQFTPSSGTNVAAVDDPLSAAADDDSTYVESSTSGHIDLFNYQNYVTYPNTVYGVKVSTRARITTNGRGKLRAKAKVSTTTANGSTQQVWSTSYKYFHQVFGKQPSGSSWDRTSLGAAQFGYERV